MVASCRAAKLVGVEGRVEGRVWEALCVTCTHASDRVALCRTPPNMWTSASECDFAVLVLLTWAAFSERATPARPTTAPAPLLLTPAICCLLPAVPLEDGDRVSLVLSVAPLMEQYFTFRWGLPAHTALLWDGRHVSRQHRALEQQLVRLTWCDSSRPGCMQASESALMNPSHALSLLLWGRPSLSNNTPTVLHHTVLRPERRHGDPRDPELVGSDEEEQRWMSSGVQGGRVYSPAAVKSPA